MRTHLLTTALGLLLVARTASAQLAPASSTATTPAISTTGEATVYVTPDQVTVSVGVETFDKALDNAKAELDKRSATLVKAIRSSGIDEKDIQTEAVEVELRYDREREDQNVRIVGHVARRSYQIKLKDASKLEALVDLVLKNGANHLFGINYETTALRKHRDEARVMAIRAAREKAVLLGEVMGMSVGSPRQISEGTAWWSYGGYRGSWGGGYGNVMAQNSVARDQGGGGGSEGTMPLGQIAVQASISVTFDMVPAEK